MAQLNNNQTPFTVNELNRIEAEIRRFNNYADGVSERLQKAVSKYQKSYERFLRENPTTNPNVVGSRTPMELLGFRQMEAEFMQEYDMSIDRAMTMNKNIGISTDLNRVDFVSTVEQIKRADFGVFEAEARSLDAMVKARLINSLVLGEDYQRTVSLLADDLLGSDEKSGKLARFANTYMNTAFVSLGRAVDMEIYEKIGGNEPDAEYIYVGPVDNKTRDFCLEHVGQTRTRAEWEEIGDSEGVDIFAEGGGWSCRHRLLLIR
jgi:hypothetical protein